MLDVKLPTTMESAKLQFQDKTGAAPKQIRLSHRPADPVVCRPTLRRAEGAHANIHGKDDDEELRSTGCILKGPTADTIAALLVPCMPPIWLTRWDWRRAASSQSQAGHWSRCYIRV